MIGQASYFSADPRMFFEKIALKLGKTGGKSRICPERPVRSRLFPPPPRSGRLRSRIFSSQVTWQPAVLYNEFRLRHSLLRAVRNSRADILRECTRILRSAFPWSGCIDHAIA